MSKSLEELMQEFGTTDATRIGSLAQQRMEDYFVKLIKPTRLYLMNRKIIEDNKCGNVVIVQQADAMIYESKDVTHWIIRTDKLVPNVVPPEYAYKVVVINDNTRLFTTMYPPADDYVTCQKCIEYVLKFQEAIYKFSWKDYNLANTELNNFKKQIEELELIVDEEYAIQFQNRVESMQDEIRKELGIDTN